MFKNLVSWGEGLFRGTTPCYDPKRRQLFRFGACLGMALSGIKPFSPICELAEGSEVHSGKKGVEIMLKPPFQEGRMSLEEAIGRRRTIRSFKDKPVTMEQFSQIFWSAQGITEKGGFKRAAPSGGALYPADVYAGVGKGYVSELSEGVYHYIPKDHSVNMTAEGDRRRDLAKASLRQMWISQAPVIYVVTAEYERITIKYGNRGIRYALIEIGHIAQNIFLQCQTLGLSAGIVGAFDDRKIGQVLGVKKDHRPLIIMPVGWADKSFGG